MLRNFDSLRSYRRASRLFLHATAPVINAKRYSGTVPTYRTNTVVRFLPCTVPRLPKCRQLCNNVRTYKKLVRVQVLNQGNLGFQETPGNPGFWLSEPRFSGSLTGAVHVRYGTIPYSTVRYGTIRYVLTPHHTVRYRTVRYRTVQIKKTQKLFLCQTFMILLMEIGKA